MRIVVIGGGVIGLACAWELARRDHDVVVVEARTIGGGVSRGNTGWICPTLISPLAAPGMVREGLRQLFGGGDAFRLRPGLDPGLLRWLVAFAVNCRARPHAAALAALTELGRGTPELYEDYVREGVELELHRDGLVIAALTEQGLESYRDHAVEEIDPSVEPALAGVAGALRATVDMHVRPETLTRGLAGSLRERGAELRENTRVQSVARRGREWIVDDLAADAVVVAAGLGTAHLVRLRTPLVGARGYSVAVGGVRPAHALYLAEARLAMSPFDGIVRLAGVLELGAPSGMTAARLVAGAAPYLAQSPVAHGEVWSGLRPATPSGVPVVRQLQPGLVAAAGHGMLGVTLAPATARRVASLL